MSIKQKKIYRLKNISIEEVVKSFQSFNAEGKLIRCELESIPLVGINMPAPQISYKKDSTNKYTSILTDKFAFLIHLIRSRQIANGGGFAPFHSVALEKILGKDYSKMLHLLYKLHLLQCDDYFQIGKKSFGFRFDDEVEFTFTYENANYLSRYFNKANKIFQSYKERTEHENRKELGNDSFYNKYNSSLSMLKLTHTDEGYKFLSLHKFINEHSRNYYYHILGSYTSYKPYITSIDKNKRIYSLATSTPRILKPFLNIKFSCDIHNSHPLLFNNILYDYYIIPLPLRLRLSTLFNNLNISPYNVSRFIRKILILNNIGKDEIANIPNDVLAYLYITSIGRFWDCVIPDDCADGLLLRSDIKVLMFAEVFYSKKLTTRGQKYAKIFKKQYPNVYKVVRKQKQEDRTQLANDMMRLESELFHKILAKLFSKRFKVISIHDAIVVLDVKANTKCTADTVKTVIRDVYNESGLCPDISVDTYDVAATLENETKANELIQSFLNKIENGVANNDEECIDIKTQLEHSQIELLPNSDYTDVILHPLNPKK